MSRRLRVAMLGPFGLHPKGTMRARALPAARSLAARGHRVNLVMPPWHTPAAAGRSWREDGVWLEYVSLAGLRWPLVGHGLVAGRMARRVRQLRPDVIHVFKPKAYGALAADLLHPRPAPIVVDTDDWEGAGGWNELGGYPPWQRRFFAWQERHGLRTAGHVTTASRALQTLAWSLGVPADRVTYLPNGLPEGAPSPPAAGWSGSDRAGPTNARPTRSHATRSQPTMSEPDGGSPRILLYTRFFEFDVARPLDVLRRVRERLIGARLVVVGEGLRGEEAALRRLAAQRDLSDAIEWHGWLEPDAARPVFESCQVAIYPFDDTLVNRTKCSVKLLELMAAGVPVVADAVGENTEVLEHGRTGCVVSSGDVDGMADEVIGLATRAQWRREIARAAQEAVAAHRTWPRLVERLEAVYRMAIGGETAPSG